MVGRSRRSRAEIASEAAGDAGGGVGLIGREEKVKGSRERSVSRQPE